jgi:hypothetical protein
VFQKHPQIFSYTKQEKDNFTQKSVLQMLVMESNNIFNNATLGRGQLKYTAKGKMTHLNLI